VAEKLLWLQYGAKNAGNKKTSNKAHFSFFVCFTKTEKFTKPGSFYSRILNLKYVLTLLSFTSG
jgi:hypothetical protein